MKIAICIPTRGDMKPGFTASLAAMRAFTTKEVPHFEVRAMARNGGFLENLAVLTEAALHWGADAILRLDDDMEFPPHTLRRLAEHEKALVGCNYINRHQHAPTTLRLLSDGMRQKVWSTWQSPPIEPVSDIALGVALIRREALEAVGRPWFTYGTTTAGQGVSEDYMFCERALAAGIQPYVDHSLSMEVGHIAETVLTFPR